jgi:Fe-S cluster assembly ATP-binding protein
MSLFKPLLAILDETDSGLDIDALKIVCDGINRYKSQANAILLITHYQRMLNYITPDFVHVFIEGKIVLTGGKELALKLEDNGYDWVTAGVTN